MTRRAVALDPAGLESLLGQRLRGRLQLRLDLDPRALTGLVPDFLEALGRLADLAVDTAPPQSELYLALSLPPSRIVAVGACRLTARWQVSGDRGGSPSGTGGRVLPLRAGVRGARSITDSTAADALRGAFCEAGWTLELEPTAGDDELRVSAQPAGAAPP